MIRLSAEQIHAFEDSAAHRFAKRVAAELPAYRGPLVAGRDEAALYAVSAAAVQRGRAFDLTSERALFQYVNLSVTLGVAFDSDPALPWAHRILRDDSYLGNEKMDDLWNAYIDYCGAVMEDGEGSYISFEALENISESPPFPKPDGTFAPLCRDLEKLWPAKAAYVGQDNLQKHISATLSRATDLGLNSPEGQAMFCRVGFILGYAFDSDPLHTWLWENDPGDEQSFLQGLTKGFTDWMVQPCLAHRDEGEEKESEA